MITKTTGQAIHNLSTALYMSFYAILLRGIQVVAIINR